MRGSIGSEVINCFREISKIPRCSGNEGAVAKYLYDRYQSVGFECTIDGTGNLLVSAPAIGNGKWAEPILLQAHLDMVCEKAHKDHDFSVDEIELCIDGDYISTRGKTTLGADDGVGIALIMAVLDDRASERPAIEAIFTVEEETTFKGAYGLGLEKLKAKRMINLDHCQENTLVVGSCGGVSVDVIVEPMYIQFSRESGALIKLTVSGLDGGHSGEDIDKGKANAIRILANLLHDIRESTYLVDIEGGMNRNAIPRDASAVLFTDPFGIDVLESRVSAYKSELLQKYNKENLELKLEILDTAVESYMDDVTATSLIDYLRLTPSGINTMEPGIPGLVSSSCNLGTIRTEDGAVIVGSEIRGTYEFEVAEQLGRIETLCKLFGFEYLDFNSYPAWKFDGNSQLAELILEVYEEELNFIPQITAVHGGLECGVFKTAMHDLEIVSMGPDVWKFHSPDEYTSISSIARINKVLKAVLKRLTENKVENSL